MQSWSFLSRKPVYQPVKDQEIAEEYELDYETITSARANKLPCSIVARSIIGLLLVVIFLISVIAGASLAKKTESPATDQNQPPSLDETLDPISTPSCPRRREWRTLSSADQSSYVDAVKCLLTRPSILHLSVDNVSAYSDFPYIHAHIGYRTHNSAPFLPWHRYLLHLYETTLRTECGYTGNLVYWDWTLDADDLASSPVFDPITGFGGDGDPNDDITVGRHGRCVVDGPFAGVEALWYDVKYSPHCLSRGFRNDDGLGKMNGQDVSKSSIDKVLALDSYEDFVREMEVRVHDAIPFGIGGDFETFSAPFDPLFYLHHVQLDQLWWQWQHRDSAKRLQAYSGHNGRHSIEQAKLSDLIHMGDLAVDIEIQMVMDTSGGDNLLCYSY